ncbi:tail fiber domain-containing protein [Bradyrhizobium sp. SZCCHNR3118]|uniref:tail fiber domain-containing protein n=1 Tax=Bradyrhizobium sp. SZCCHNR3118 TaxID=3057468 RepID=UPI0029162D79|nr:tail fiber domain-containing protein [Bradyrhizobium sp. SZCCHNR3118]
MARRFDQNYRVKPRDNLGDPEYWNRRFEDIDRRISSNEDGLDSIGGLTAYVEGLALNRLDLVLAPALDKIALVSEQGFLLAHSSSTVKLDTATTQTFGIQDAAERELFAPSPYVTIVREANQTDYAFAKLVSWDRASGQLVLLPMQIFGNPGPFNDWVIYVGSAVSQAVSQMLLDTQAARDAAKGYRDAAAASATQTGQDKAAIGQMKTDVLAARDAAAASAEAAKTWDPTNYIAKNAAGTYQQQISFALNPIVGTLATGDNSDKAASTAYVKNAIDALIAGAPGTMDTLNEIAAKITSDESVVGALTTTVAGKLQKDQNLSDLTDKAAARTNLGLVGATPTGKAGTSAAGGSAVTYLRSDASIPIDFTISPTWTGTHLFQLNSGVGIGFQRNTFGALTVYAPDQGAAIMSFHRGAYAIQASLDNDNWWRLGGWSDGGQQRFGVSAGGDGYFRTSLGVGTGPVGGGTIVATGDIVYGWSDERLKADIKVITDAVAKVKKIRGVTYLQSELAKLVGAPEQKGRRAGLLAQELADVLPEAITLAPFDLDQNGESKSGQDFLNIQYVQVIALLLEAVKELADRVEALEGT